MVLFKEKSHIFKRLHVIYDFARCSGRDLINVIVAYHPAPLDHNVKPMVFYTREFVGLWPTAHMVFDITTSVSTLALGRSKSVLVFILLNKTKTRPCSGPQDLSWSKSHRPPTQSTPHPRSPQSCFTSGWIILASPKITQLQRQIVSKSRQFRLPISVTGTCFLRMAKRLGRLFARLRIYLQLQMLVRLIPWDLSLQIAILHQKTHIMIKLRGSPSSLRDALVIPIVSSEMLNVYVQQTCQHMLNSQQISEYVYIPLCFSRFGRMQMDNLLDFSQNTRTLWSTWLNIHTKFSENPVLNERGYMCVYHIVNESQLLHMALYSHNITMLLNDDLCTPASMVWC